MTGVGLTLAFLGDSCLNANEGCGVGRSSHERRETSFDPSHGSAISIPVDRRRLTLIPRQACLPASDEIGLGPAAVNTFDQQTSVDWDSVQIWTGMTLH